MRTDFRYSPCTFRYYRKINNYQNQEHNKANSIVPTYNKITKGLNDFPGCIWTTMTI